MSSNREDRAARWFCSRAGRIPPSASSGRLSGSSHVETIGFDYGQRHAVEIEARQAVRSEIARHFPSWGARLGADHMLALPTLAQISDTALTRDAEITMTDAGLPSTFVPGRNILFFTYAAALGYRRGIADLVGGMCETDYSGYPDCRNETLQSLRAASASAWIAMLPSTRR